MVKRTAHTDAIQAAAARWALPFPVVEALVLQESSGQADAFRYEPAFYERYIRTNSAAKGFHFGPLAACSYGLMQIMLQTALEIGYDDRPEYLFIAAMNLEWGCKVLKGNLLWAHGDIEQALAAYNGGKHGNTARPFRNADYVSRVLARVQGGPASPLTA